MIKKALQRYFIRFLIKHLFNTIDKDDVLRVVKGKVMFKGRALSLDVIEKLKEDCAKFKNSTLWKILSNELKYLHNIKMYEESMDYQSMLMGKMGLYNLDIIEQKLNQIESL